MTTVVENCSIITQKGQRGTSPAYGFCLENNSADTVALKIKVPEQMLPELISQRSYTSEIVRLHDLGRWWRDTSNSSSYDQFKEGLLFFIANNRIHEDLVRVFLWLVKALGRINLLLGCRLSGLNHLRQAVESKAALIGVNTVKSV